MPRARRPRPGTREYFVRKHGQDAKTPPARGWDAVTVPGAVAAWVALSERFGKLPFADLMAPAAEIAERGYAVPVIVQQKWTLASKVAELTAGPGFADTFLPRGRVPAVGERFTMPHAARALKLIGASKGEAFYRGEIAQAIAAWAQQHGGAMTAADLAAYQPEWVTPLAQDYRGHTLHEIPPNGQGIAAQMALGMLQHFDLGSMPVDGPACQHLQIEAMKLAFADVYRFVADPRHMEGAPSQLLDAQYLASRAKLIDPARAQVFGPGYGIKGGTIYLSTADASGMMVSFIQSNYMGFGSGVVEPELRHQPAEPRPRLLARRQEPELRGAGQAAVPHHHPGLPEPGRPAGDELRRDGRQHPAAGPYPDPRAHARPRPEPAGRLRRAALALQPGAGDQRRAAHAGGHARGPGGAGPPE